MHEKLLGGTPIRPLETSRYSLGNYSRESNIHGIANQYP
jgi:hypothetical protein